MRLHGRRPPIASQGPVLEFAAIRLLLSVVAVVAVVAAGFPAGGKLAVATAGFALPWSLAMLLLARRNPRAALNPLVAAGDIAVLALIEAIAPETYGAVRFVALFAIAAHGQLQGMLAGTLVAAGGVVLLVPIAAVSDSTPVGGQLLAVYEVIFAVCAFASAWLGANIRTAETAGRLRARELTRRLFETENEVRRRVASSIHDGPVQELTSVDLILTAAGAAADRGDRERVKELLGETRDITARSLDSLRDELVALSPQPYQGLSFETAMVERASLWSNRYGVQIDVRADQIDLPPDVSGALFQIAQEAIVNAGRHADAEHVEVALRRAEGGVELCVSDDGHGFAPPERAEPQQPGHFGIESMRERAALIDAQFSIESSPSGTVVRVRVPLRSMGPGS